MKKNSYKEMKRSRLLTGIVAAGFVLGIFFTSIWNNRSRGGSSLLAEEVLVGMKYVEIESDVFFCYVLQKRLGAVFLLVLLSTTWMGVIFAYSYSAWLGLSAGTLVATAVMQYGAKGVLLVFVAVFPQIILYVPVTFYLLEHCFEFCMMLYYPHRVQGGRDKKEGFKQIFLRLLPLLLVVIIGCFLESYVNPTLMKKFLKIF